MKIEDGRGKGNLAYVDDDQYLRVAEKGGTYEHWHSEYKESAYSALFSHVTLNNATENVAFLQNDNANGRFISVWGIRVQVLDYAGGTAPPSSTFYFDVVKDLTYASGGTAVVPRNLNASSGKSAVVTCYEGTSSDITPAGTAVVLEKHFVEAEGKPQELLTRGSLLLGQGKGITVRCTTDNTSGKAYVTILFVLED